MDNMNNLISRESIDSLNNFIANYERERDARKAHKEQELKAFNECIAAERAMLESTLSYKVAQALRSFVESIFELVGFCLACVGKFTLAALFVLFPALAGVLIECCL